MLTPDDINEIRRRCEAATEEWKPVVGFEGWYSVSNLGRVRRDRGSMGTYANRVLSCATNRPYNKVTIYKHDKQFTKMVHRLVAEAFLGACPDGLEVNHKNGDKRDNRSDNLEYVTGLANKRHAIEVLGKHRRGECLHNAVLTENAVRDIRATRSTGKLSLRALARQFRVTDSTIASVVNHKTWRHVS